MKTFCFYDTTLINSTCDFNGLLKRAEVEDR